MPHPFDATLKDLFTPSPEDLVSAFGLSDIRPVVPLNVDLSTISAATDMAVGLGNPLQEIIDLNFQSGPDPKLAARCHLYNAALHHRFDLPVRTVVVLLRPKADASHLTGKLTYACGLNGVQFPYDVIRMWEQPAELFLKAGVNALPLATLCRLSKGRPAKDQILDMFRQIERRLVTECEYAQAARLRSASFILLELRPQGEKMRSIITEEMLKESTFVQWLERHTASELHRILLRQGKIKFGIPSESAEHLLKSINDVERLERLGDAIITVNSWDELLATP
jgi:hypothetical protein